MTSVLIESEKDSPTLLTPPISSESSHPAWTSMPIARSQGIGIRYSFFSCRFQMMARRYPTKRINAIDYREELLKAECRSEREEIVSEAIRTIGDTGDECRERIGISSYGKKQGEEKKRKQ